MDPVVLKDSREPRVVFPQLAALLSLVFCNRQTGVHSWAIMTSIPSPTQGSERYKIMKTLNFLISYIRTEKGDRD